MELNNLGKKVGILTSEEINQETQRLLTLPKEGSSFDLNVPPKTSAFSRTFMSTSYDTFPKRNPPATSNARVKTGNAPKSSRFNETRQVMSSRDRTRSAKTKSGVHSHEKCILCDHETDRELWVNNQHLISFMLKFVWFICIEALENSNTNIEYRINARSSIVARLGFTST